MFWKINDINPHFLTQYEQVKQLIQAYQVQSTSYRYAIIGGGPKGFYALKTLIKNLRDLPLSTAIQIDWFNEDSYFSCGQNFNIHQPEYMYINNCIGHINAWKVAQDTFELNFADWISANNKHLQQALPTDFSSRALVGYYLMDALLLLLKDLHPNIHINFIVDRIHDIQEQESARSVLIGKHSYGSYSSVMICSGHSYGNKLPEKLDSTVEQLSGVCLRQAYPVSQMLAIQKSEDVAVMGLGLTFTDTVLALTEGRGGKFIGKTYFPSDNEVGKIYAFSRNNLPMICRGAIFGKEKYQLQYIGPQTITDFKARSGEIDFVADILPLIKKEVTFAYYSVLWKNLGLPKWAIEERIETIKNPFSLEHLLNPRATAQFSSYQEYADFIYAYLRFTIAEAKKGVRKSPYMAAASVWREASPILAELYNFQGFSGQSQQEFDQQWSGSLSRISFGPPIESMEKILTLIEKGKLKIVFEQAPELTVLEDKLLLSEHRKLFVVTNFIDARIGKNKGPHLLFDNLLQSGIAQKAINEQYEIGPLAINRQGKLISPSDLNIYLYGTPTEGNTLDNDSLSTKTHDFASPWVADILKTIPFKEFQHA